MTDPVADVDALVGAIGPRLSAPVIARRDAVLVTGPWLAGVSGVAAVLRERLPQHTFVEAADLAPGEAPSAVVFVVSAAAVLTGSDAALLDAAATDTDPVIGVVSKIDVHRNWRDVLAADRETLAEHAPRYGGVRWVGAAAAPERGEPRVDDLIAAVGEQLADPDLARRNRLRAWESRLQTVACRYDRDAEGAGRRARVEALREQRNAVLRQRRLSKSERTIALRSQVQQARVQLSYFARNRCASVRSELQEDAAGLSRRKLPGFEAYARGRVEEVVTEVDEGTTAHLTDVAQALGLAVEPPAAELPRVEIGAPPLKSRRLETRLMMLLGAGFGLGVALTLSRLLLDLAPGLTAAGIVACVAIGLAVTVWVVGTRGLLADRAVLDRWVGEATGSLRSAVEQLVATRVLAAESALSAALGEHDEAESAHVADQVSVIDTELREHAVAAARAAALRDREMPTLRAALDAVRAQLGECAHAETATSAPTIGADKAI
ncbi:hypothetical protein [Mycobacterium branderi]|uniref:Uncharacterized protein n=1 Tax=Mycobacterium branderi TaxID=43348 RepID=A0A7I7W2F1_9MYCO|nr:hypothetical protein [Mycobacterium branderi]MCV7235520.1 hypothetical protein [Mycobacterium branderi]ORA34309.1 hypothetical protein BST20_19985 [Mycobacterium branderi]BBZ11122.1 hypothetical protein MBRA_13170 [Mycobacterium branderi]